MDFCPEHSGHAARIAANEKMNETQTKAIEGIRANTDSTKNRLIWVLIGIVLQLVVFVFSFLNGGSP